MNKLATIFLSLLIVAFAWSQVIASKNVKLKVEINTLQTQVDSLSSAYTELDSICAAQQNVIDLQNETLLEDTAREISYEETDVTYLDNIKADAYEIVLMNEGYSESDLNRILDHFKTLSYVPLSDLIDFE